MFSDGNKSLRSAGLLVEKRLYRKLIFATGRVLAWCFFSVVSVEKAERGNLEDKFAKFGGNETLQGSDCLESVVEGFPVSSG